MALRLGKIKINRLWILVVSAILLGLLATWLSITYLHNREKAIEIQLTERAKGGEKISVIVPTSDLPAGAIVQEGTVAARDIAIDLVYKNTLRVEDFERISGLPLLRPVEKGRPLMREDLIDDSPKQFAESITKGMRALTIEIDALNSISQMLKPGNFIDLHLITADQGGPTPGGQEVLLFLQHVKVLATGTTTQQDLAAQSKQQQSAYEEAVAQYNTVTVEVTPEEAAYIALAQQSGKIRATLRNVGDNEIADYPSVNSTKLVGFGKKVAKGAKYDPAADARVQYIVGGQAGSGSAAPININVPGIPGLTPPVPGNAASVGTPSVAASPVNNAMNQAFTAAP